MARPSKAVKYHKTKGCYSTGLPGSPSTYHYWGTHDEAEAYRLFHRWMDRETGTKPFLPCDDENVPASTAKVIVNPKHLQEYPDSPLSTFVRTGKLPEPEPPADIPNRDSDVRTLTDCLKVWRENKTGQLRPRTIDDYTASWTEFVKIMKRLSITDLNQVDKAALREYRSRIKRKTTDTSRLARVKAIIRHVMSECDIFGVDEQRQGYLIVSLGLLKTKVSKGTIRLLKPDELKALLRVCDQETAKARKDIDRLNATIAKARRGSPEFQTLAGKLLQARHRLYLSVQAKAVYLVSVNLLYYPCDTGRLPVDAVDLASGVVMYDREKTDTPRVGLLLNATVKAIRAWIKVRQEYGVDDRETLFLTTIGTPWGKKSVGQLLDRHKRLADLPDDLTPKCFCKGGYDAALQDEDVDLYTAKILAGHRTGITNAYVKANPKRVRKAVASIGRVYGLGGLITAKAIRQVEKNLSSGKGK